MPLSTDEASIKEVTTSMYPVLQDEDLLVVRGYSDLLGPASQITEKGESVYRNFLNTCTDTIGPKCLTLEYLLLCIIYGNQNFYIMNIHAFSSL